MSLDVLEDLVAKSSLQDKTAAPLPQEATPELLARDLPKDDLSRVDEPDETKSEQETATPPVLPQQAGVADVETFIGSDIAASVVLSDEPQAIQNEALSHDAEQQGRGGYGPETWAGLKARLQERAGPIPQKKTPALPPPQLQAKPQAQLRTAVARALDLVGQLWAMAAPRLLTLWGDVVWNARLLWRWKRPVLKASWHQTSARVLVQSRAAHETVAQVVIGSTAWYVRKLRQDPELRVRALVGLAGFVGTGLVLALGVWIWSIWPESGPDDFGVAPPPAELFGVIEARPDVPPRVIGGPSDQATLPSSSAAPRGFMFEAFAGRNSAGKLIADGVGGQNALRRLFPRGTKATRFLDFMGSYYLRGQGKEAPSGDEIIEAVRQRCTGLPLGKVFRTTTITCTYTHSLEGGHRVLWIVAVSADNAERLSELSATARVIR